MNSRRYFIEALDLRVDGLTEEQAMQVSAILLKVGVGHLRNYIELPVTELDEHIPVVNENKSHDGHPYDGPMGVFEGMEESYTMGDVLKGGRMTNE